jgi:hypothetical protein
MISAASSFSGSRSGRVRGGPRQLEPPVDLMGPSGRRPGSGRARTQLGPQSQEGQTRLVRCARSLHTAFSNSLSSRSYSAGSTAPVGGRSPRQHPAPTFSASRRRGRRPGAAGAQRRLPRRAPRGHVELAARVTSARARSSAQPRVRGGDGVRVGQYDDPGHPIRHQHEPRAEPRVSTAVAQRSEASVRPLPSRATRVLPWGHPPAPPAATSGRAVRGPAAPTARRNLQQRPRPARSGRPSSDTSRPGWSAGSAGGVAPGVGIGALGHRQRHPHVR